MAILPVSSVSVTNNKSAIQFGARKNKGSNVEQDGYNSHKASGMVTIPTALFLALASSSFNAQSQNQYNFDFDNSENIELMAMNNPQAVRSSSARQVGRGDLPDIMKITGSKNIYQKDFMMDGKKWTMYYHNANVERHLDKVTQIYFIPADFRIVKDCYGFEVNYPPEMEAFIVHEANNQKDTFGAVKILEVTCNKDGSNRKRVVRELKLPDDISEELVQLYLGKTNFSLDDDLQEEFSIVKTPNLMTPQVSSFER